ncbi:hypothetical protein [Bacillus sp. T33-2]|uniref:hypothetical protein n=1 Tax=Bacillus sp. T33-2 TaxID=2054168 RepID=UPI000C7888AE|nr:hypothetical protein [Bacillus sp. T33-2]PLR99573.1 hypothetical protein CVD19_00485 [Bacillus sp. T33-2]
MPIPLNGWSEFRDIMQPYIDKAYKQEITFQEFDQILQEKMNELHAKYDNRKELVGWLGGDYDDLGFYDDKEDAERGHRPTEKFYDLIDDEFKGKKVRITIEVIE